jgi:O-methyltransferase
MSFIGRLWRKLIIAMSMPIILADFFTAGAEYGISSLAKVLLVWRMWRNTKTIETASSFIEHLAMATQILKVPKLVEGCVVECGSYKGGSATNLSLICAACDRELEIFDSFRGLPQPSEHDQQHVLISSSALHAYAEGSFCGNLAEVEGNISRYGHPEVCKFNVGYFADTLPHFRRRCVLVFADVDLVDSLRACLEYLWPLVQDSCCFFTHEARHLEISSLFFDQEWWSSHLGSPAPGLIGAGSGLGLLPENGGFGSNLAFTVRSPQIRDFKTEQQTGSEQLDERSRVGLT